MLCWSLSSLLPLGHKASKDWVLGLHSFSGATVPPGCKHFHITYVLMIFRYVSPAPTNHLDAALVLPAADETLYSYVPQSQCTRNEVDLSYLMCSYVFSQLPSCPVNSHLWLCSSRTQRTVPNSHSASSLCAPLLPLTFLNPVSLSHLHCPLLNCNKILLTYPPASRPAFLQIATEVNRL